MKPAGAPAAQVWRSHEIAFELDQAVPNPFVEVEAWARFVHESGEEIIRPAFWDGGSTFRVRFAPTLPGRWEWFAESSRAIPGISGQRGDLLAEANAGLTAFDRHGFWHIPKGERNLVHADGVPRLIVADTAWALPWRATPEEALIYSRDRARKGFNAALLMSVQPDRRAIGPRNRHEHDGFDVGFEDLPDGHLNQLVPEYFQRVDELAAILVAHGICPVWQPVFHGYGWKGLDVAGPVIPPDEYARYCRYLVARYGAYPAIWLVGGDGDGLAPGVDPGGAEIERWDAYGQPTGIHYAPHQHPDAYQDRDWLDFQWCQTGHNGEHVPQRVAMMWERRPIKAVANGEPTYEEIGQSGRASGWWQGHEAWSNLTAGGTMGVVYGAGSLWQWRRDAEEAHACWCIAEGAGWREALDFEGSRFVGLISKLFEGLPLRGMEPDYRHTFGRQSLIVPGKLLLVYLPTGGGLVLARSEGVPDSYRVLDPRTGMEVLRGTGHDPLDLPSGEPLVVVYSG